MSIAKLIITAVTVEGLSQQEAAVKYGVSKGWVSKLMGRWRAEGDTACEPRSRRPHVSPGATPPDVVERIVSLRADLGSRGLDAGPDTIGWHLEHEHHVKASRATIARILTREGLITAEPKKRPRSSYIRFEAAQPNQCWQSDFTHYRLTRLDGKPGADTEILTWLDDCSRVALRVDVFARVTAPIVVDTFRQAIADYGVPASTLTDNGMVYTVRLAGQGRQGGRTSFEAELARLHIAQKNGQPNHPQTQGKVERFQQTMNHWPTAQQPQPASITELQALVDEFVEQYNQRRPHRSLPGRSTPAARYQAIPKAAPAATHADQTHNRVRVDKIDKTGAVTLRHQGHLHHIGLGRTHAGTCITMLIQDRHITIIDTITGTVLRELDLDPTRDYQPISETNNR
jgi:transposase InsO family protein